MHDNASPVLLSLTTQSSQQPAPAATETPQTLSTVPQLRLHSPESIVAEPDADSADHETAAAIVDGLLKAAHRLRGVLSHHFAQFDLSDVRYTVLRMLADSEPDGCTQADVAAHLDQSESSISMLIKRMRNSELLFRLRSLDDKRKWVLRLTNRGRELLQNVEDCHAKRMSELLSEFSESERESLCTQLQKLLTILATTSQIGGEEQTSPTAARVAAPIHRADASPAA